MLGLYQVMQTMTQLNRWFQIATGLALIGWALILLAPGHAWVEAAVRGILIVGLCAIYCYLVFAARHLDSEPARGSFWTLSGVIALFRSPRVVLAGWVHYLAFDLAVALWIRNDAAALGIGHLWLLPVYLLTLMFGPAGLLLYLALRGVQVWLIGVP